MSENSFFETIKVCPDTQCNLIFHKERIKRTIDELHLPLKIDSIDVDLWLNTKLNEIVSNSPTGRLRINFIPKSNSITTETINSPLREYRVPQRIRVSTDRRDESDSSWQYKLCRNQIQFLEEDIDDLLIINQKGEVCETTRANFYLLLNNNLVTPPLSSGVLAGTRRSKLLAEGYRDENGHHYHVIETPIKQTQLAENTRFFLSNALMGLLPAQVVK